MQLDDGTAVALPPHSRVIAGSVVDHIGRTRELADVQTEFVRLADLEDATAVERFAPVIAALR